MPGQVLTTSLVLPWFRPGNQPSMPLVQRCRDNILTKKAKKAAPSLHMALFITWRVAHTVSHSISHLIFCILLTVGSCMTLAALVVVGRTMLGVRSCGAPRLLLHESGSGDGDVDNSNHMKIGEHLLRCIGWGIASDERWSVTI